jgi:hypothetical protein
MDVERSAREKFDHIMRVFEKQKFVPFCKNERDGVTTHFFALESDGDACDFLLSIGHGITVVEYSGSHEGKRVMMRLTYDAASDAWRQQAEGEETIDCVQPCDQASIDEVLYHICLMASPETERSSWLFL